MGELAKVIPLFPGLKQVKDKDAKKPSCFNCQNAAFGNRGGTFCITFREEILNEDAAAADCESFVEDDDDE